MLEDNLEEDTDFNEEDETSLIDDLVLGMEILRDAGVSKEVMTEFLNELLTSPKYGHGDLDAIEDLMKSKFNAQQMIELKNIKIVNGKKI